MTGGALASAVVSPVACALDTSALQNFEGRLSVRTKSGVRTTASGTQRLGLDQGRDAILQMPAVIPNAPMPLLVLLHGAGGWAERQVQRMGSAPSDAGVAVLRRTRAETPGMRSGAALVRMSASSTAHLDASSIWCPWTRRDS